MWLHRLMRRVLVVRHGQSAWNAEGRWQGWIDVPLTDLGEAQARARGAALAAAGLDVPEVFSSDLARARRTAELVAADIGATVVTDARLRERNGGDWQGYTATEIDERWPGLREQWRRRELHAPPNGEGDDDVLVRFDAAMHDISGRDDTGRDDTGRDVVVVTHGGLLRLVADSRRHRRA